MQTPETRVAAARHRPLRLVGAVSIVLVLVALALAWTVTPLSRVFDPRALAAYGQQLRDWPFAPLVVVMLYVASGLIATPGTLMIGATVLLFGAWPGAPYAFVGMMVNGAVVYAIGRFAARATVDEWLARRAGSPLETFNRLIARRGFASVALLRLTPIPYSLQNLAIGASHIGWPDFIVGTSIGILPVITVMTGAAGGLHAWLSDPSWSGLFALVSTAVVVLSIAWIVKRWSARNRGPR